MEAIMMQLENLAFPELAELRALAHDLERLDDFAAAYVRNVEDIALEMHRIAGTDKLLMGLYRRKLAAFRAVLMDQVAWLETQRVEGEA